MKVDRELMQAARLHRIHAICNEIEEAAFERRRPELTAFERRLLKKHLAEGGDWII